LKNNLFILTPFLVFKLLKIKTAYRLITQSKSGYMLQIETKKTKHALLSAFHVLLMINAIDKSQIPPAEPEA